MEENIISALALLDSNNRHSGRPEKPKTESYHKIILFPDHCEAFYGNRQIPLTENEFPLFHYLVINKGITLSFSQIFSSVWREGYEDKDPHVLWNQIKRLRRKIEAATGVKGGYIVNVIGVGYKLPL